MKAHAGRIWAVARMTLLEAVRRKVFFILLIFGVAVLAGTLFFPAVDSVVRLRILQAWSLRAATLFSAIVGLFLAGFSIPSDVEQKRVYLLVTKPLPKPSLFLGRLLGFSLLLAIFIGATGLISTSFMRVVSWAGGASFPRPVARPRIPATDLHDARAQDVDGIPGKVILHEPGASLTWTFPGLSRGNFDGPIRAQIRLFMGSPKDRYRAEGHVLLAVKGPAGTKELEPISLNTNEERDILLPTEVLGEGGTLEVEVRVVDEDGLLAGDVSRLVIYEKPIPFEIAYLGGMGLVLLQSLTVLALTLAASTMTSGPLAVLLGILLYMIGTVHGFFLEGTRDLDRSMEVEQTEGRAKSGTVRDLPTGLVRVANWISKAVLKAVPDFDRFDYGRWLLHDTAVSWREAGTAGLHALPVFLACSLLGILVMAWRDLGG